VNYRWLGGELIRVRPKLLSSAQGNASLYAMLIVPFAILLSSSAVDVSRWNGTRNSLQLDADRLALLAAEMLPAKEGVQSYLESNLAASVGDNRAVLSISWPEADSSSVTVNLAAELSPGIVGSFFGPQRISRSATAALVPADYAVIIADGSSLRPSVLFNGAASIVQAPWGDNNEWPKSGYFDCVLPPVPSEGQYGWSWWDNWAGEPFQRWLTQACYNPVLSELKAAAINIVDTVASDSRARLSVYFTPGDNQFERFTRVRSIHGQQDDPNLYSGQRGGFLSDTPTSAQADFSDFVELSQLGGDELCFLLSDPISALNDRFAISSNDLPNPNSQSCPEGAFAPFCGDRHRPFGRIHQCYRTKQWSLRESIYYRQARLRTPDFEATPDIEAALTTAFGDLIDERSPSALARAREIRGNLSSKVRRRIVVITDNLPSLGSGPDSFGSKLVSIAGSGTEIQFVAVAHEYLTPVERDLLIAHSEHISDLNHRNIEVSVAHKMEELSTKIVPSIMLTNRQISLVR
jgi:hypothetical protein